MTFKATTPVVWWWKCRVHKSSSPESPSSGVACNSSNTTTLRVFLHIVACIASLALGLRFSREPLLVGICVIQQQPQALLLGEHPAARLKWLDNQQQIQSTAAAAPMTVSSKSSRVHVGRHEILVRPWPHPNPSELAAAQAIIDRVQREQRKLYEAGQEGKNPIIIAITTTVHCPFRALHLKMLGNALSLAPAKITWIVVEAGGPSNATAEVLEASGVSHFHLGFADSAETRLRIEGLRFVRENKLEGIVIFADATNTHSLHLFDEVQKVKWVGAFAVGFPVGGSQLLEEAAARDEDAAASNAHQTNRGVLVNRPVCNQSSAQSQIVGWQTALDSLQLSWHQHVPLNSEWSGFAINAKMLWLEDEERPGWIASWEHWSSSEDANIVGGLNGLVKNESVVEALGNCGQDVLLWWLRIEPCAEDCRYPSRWVIGPPLEVVVPWRRTPWPPASLPRPPAPPSPPPPPASSLRPRFNQSELNMEPTRLGPKQKSPSRKKKKRPRKNNNNNVA